MDRAWAVRRPHPVVRPLVSRYIGYEQHNVTLPVHRGLPSRHVTLIISLQQPVRATGRTTTLAARGLIGGLQTQPVLITQDRTQCGMHLELHPLAVPTLLGVCAADLSGRILRLEDVERPTLAELPDRLASTPSWTDRFRILDEVLAALAVEPRPVSAELGRAWRVLLDSGGRVRMAHLAREIGWSRRYFSERFRAETGLTPKNLARILRFEHAGMLLRRGKVENLATLALECGYYDQAHLSNEWRMLAGCSPRTWITEELPFLQDSESAVVKTNRHG